MSEKKIESRAWLTEGREKLGLDRQAFGVKVGCSEKLMDILEDGNGITHPHIAARIVRLIGGDVGMYNQIVHEEHRTEKLPRARKIMACTPEEPMMRVCMNCGKEFVPFNDKQRCCSMRCAGIKRHKDKNQAMLDELDRKENKDAGK